MLDSDETVWVVKGTRRAQSCKQVQWCQEELADPLLNPALKDTHSSRSFPTHVHTHIPLFHQKRCHTTICHTCTSSSREINPGSPFDGWRLCFWRDKPTSTSTSNTNTVVPKGLDYKPVTSSRNIAQPAHPKPQIKRLDSVRQNSCISHGPWKYSDIILDSSAWPEPALNYYHLGKKHLYQLDVFNIPLGSMTLRLSLSSLGRFFRSWVQGIWGCRKGRSGFSIPSPPSFAQGSADQRQAVCVCCQQGDRNDSSKTNKH